MLTNGNKVVKRNLRTCAARGAMACPYRHPNPWNNRATRGACDFTRESPLSPPGIPIVKPLQDIPRCQSRRLPVTHWRDQETRAWGFAPGPLLLYSE